MSGLTETPLLKKLGYQPGQCVVLLHAPEWFADLLHDGRIILNGQSPDWTHTFFTSETEVSKWLETHDLETSSKGLWVSWPKKASGVPSDLTEQTFRNLILPRGWVDIKVCAIDDTWSGLKFVRRKIR